ncbi:FtsX-like permease family protein [Streptomyces hydrogenans]|uniref:FtsX-like permease family protein n=1 Tax=Streptomyces hydrogenans TaxID=1873719 RepID=UPI0035DF22DB
MSRWSFYTWWRDGRSLRRSLPALALLTAAVGLCAGVAGGAATAVERDVLGSGGLTQVELDSFEGDASVRPLTGPALREAARVPGVERVVGDHPATLYAAEDGTYDLSSRTLTPADDLPVVAGRLPGELGAGDVVLPVRAQGTEFGPVLGRTVAFGYTRATGVSSGTTDTVRLRVVALYDPAWQSDGRDVAYLAEATAARLAAARSSEGGGHRRAESAVVVVEHQSRVAEVTRALQAKGFSAAPVSDRVRHLPGLFGLASLGMRGGVLVLAVGAVVLGAVRAADSARARLGQFAVLRVLGVGRGELRRILIGEALLTGGVAGVAGAAAGTLGSVLLAGPLSGTLGLPIAPADALPGPYWTLAVLLLPVAGLAAGVSLGSREALRRDPYLAVREHV